MKRNFLMFLTACCVSMASCEKADIMGTPSGAEGDTKVNAAYKSAENSARQTFMLDEEQSVIEWWGSGPGASHHGSFGVTSQSIEAVNGKVKAGSFSIPIASIKNFDLPDHIKPVLLDHLKSADFFNMVQYPEATFTFTKALPLNKAVTGAVAGANVMVSGDFTMLGQTLPISFPARVEMVGNQLSMEAKLKIDRTKWGMNYAADPALGDHHIYPEVALHLKLMGNRLNQE